jgi:hypothetical protein
MIEMNAVYDAEKIDNCYASECGEKVRGYLGDYFILAASLD